MDSIRKISIATQEGDWHNLSKTSQGAVMRAVGWCVKHQHALPRKTFAGIPHREMLDIIDACLKEEFNTSLANLRERNKKRSVVDIRNMVMLIYRNKVRITLSEIGDIFGLTHATVLHGIENAKFLIDFDRKYHDSYYSFKSKIDKKCEEYLTIFGERGSSQELF